MIHPQLIDSFWRKTAPHTHTFKKLTTSIPKVDVCIVGAGNYIII